MGVVVLCRALIVLGVTLGLLVLAGLVGLFVIIKAPLQAHDGDSALSSCVWSPYSLITLTIYRRINRVRLYLKFSTWRFENTEENTVLMSISTFVENITSISHVICFVSVLGIALCLPTYIMKILEDGSSNVTHSTREHVYRWQLSYTYTSGWVPALILLLVWAVVVSITIHSFLRYKAMQGLNQRDSTGVENGPSKSAWMLVFLMFLINLVVVGAVNGAYVYTTLIKLSSSSRLGIQIAVAAFKFCYSFGVLPSYLLRPIGDSKQGTGILLSASLMNSLLIPCAVTALTSPSCFQGLLVEPDEITSSYSYRQCSAHMQLTASLSVCVGYEQQVVDVVPLVPPFAYNYDCSSTVLAAYVPVYLILYAFLILLPLGELALFQNVHRSNVHEVFHRLCPGIVWQDAWMDDADASESSGNRKRNMRSLLRVQSIAVAVAHRAAMLLTFGLCSPVLALVIGGSTYLLILRWRVLIGRYQYNVISQVIRNHCVDESEGAVTAALQWMQSSPTPTNAQQNQISQHSAMLALANIINGYHNAFHACVKPILLTSAILITLAAADFVGDKMGGWQALWVVCSMAGIVSATCIGWSLLRKLSLCQESTCEGVNRGEEVTTRATNPMLVCEEYRDTKCGRRSTLDMERGTEVELTARFSQPIVDD